MINYIDLVRYFRSFLYNKIYSDHKFMSNIDSMIRSNNFVNGVTWTILPFTVYIHITPSIDNPEPMNYKFIIDNIFGTALENVIREREQDFKEEGSKLLLSRNLAEGSVDTFYNCLVNNIYRLFSSCVYNTGQNKYQIVMTL